MIATVRRAPRGEGIWLSRRACLTLSAMVKRKVPLHLGGVQEGKPAKMGRAAKGEVAVVPFADADIGARALSPLLVTASQKTLRGLC